MLIKKVIFLFYLMQSTDIFTNGLELIPEKAGITYVNEKYVSNIAINVRRFSRNSKYVVNMNITTLTSWDKNLTISIILYEFLHNEYRRSFVEMQLNVCDLLKDQFLGPTLTRNGLHCPVEAETYHLTNMSIIVENFPYVWPFQRGKGEMIAKTKATGEFIASGYICFTVKQTATKKKT